MKYYLRKVFTYKNILLILLLFFLLFFIYSNLYQRSKTVVGNFVNIFKEGFTNTPDGRSEENRFKIDNIEKVLPPDALMQTQKKIQNAQLEVDNFLNSQSYEPINNDEDAKNAIGILYNNYNNKFSSAFAKLYFFASTVPVLLEPFVYDKNKMACQYNTLLKCYPKTFKNGDDYREMYSIIILADIAKDITNSELDPKTAYFGYITDPILYAIEQKLKYFYNKL